MDLSNIQMEDTSDVILRHPVTGEVLKNDDGTTMTITVYGPDSKKHRAVKQMIQRKLLKMTAEEGKTPDPVDSIDVSVEWVAGVTAAWNITLNGKCPDCTYNNAMNLYEKYPWILEQVDSFMSSRANFMKDSSSN